MKAVARLVAVYFTGTPLLRAVTAFGLIAIVFGVAALAYLPPLVGQVGLPSRFSIAEEALLMLVPIAGVVALLFGGSLMPAMVTQLARGHYAHVLPHARGKLLASALATVALVTIVASAALRVFMGQEMPDIELPRQLAGSFLTYSTTYLALWVVSRTRGPLALIGGALVLVVTLFLPLRFMGRNVPMVWAVVPSVALWIAVAGALLLAPRLAAVAATWRRAGAFAGEYAGGDELALLLGTSRPWLLAIGQIVPIVVAAYLVGWLYGSVAVDLKVKVWLFYLMILSVLSAATASFGAARSRALWLRADWTRAQLFARVEAAFWTRNGYALGVLLLTMVAVGSFFELPNRALAFGLVLLVLATAVSTYLGLLITRAISARVAALAVGGMLLLIATSIYATSPSAPVTTVVALELALGVLAGALRTLAKRRWLELDWMSCRPDRTARGAA
jgi:hypothetical protein